tara:strand:- start:3804 stop:6845 length:3042 start_codon:yes stop_codon:yes gene_type:complete
MKIIILGAGKNLDNDKNNYLNKLIGDSSILEWKINSFIDAGFKKSDIYFIGGFEINKIKNNIPHINYYYNQNWETSHVLSSIKVSLKFINQNDDLLFVYADTIFRTDFIIQFINQSKNGINLAFDNSFKLNHENLSEKIYKIKDIYHFTKEHHDHSFIGQFTGLTLIKNVTKDFINSLKKTKSNEKLSFCDFLDDFKKDKIDLNLINSVGNWAEIDNENSFANFVFGSKAETLQRIRPLLKKGTICDQISFSVLEWESNKNLILNNIYDKFPNVDLIIRSSSLEEDSWVSSQAGAFDSIFNINSNKKKLLESSIEKVISVYKSKGKIGYNKQNQVLVQPMIKDVKLSGVAFTKDIVTGGPYYVINYDESSKSTDSITSGKSVNDELVKIYKKIDKNKIQNPNLYKIFDCLVEIEYLTSYDSLDIEFAIDNDNKLWIFQVRPLVGEKFSKSSVEFEKYFNQTLNEIDSKLMKLPFCYGEKGFFSDMSDWNPAEMISSKPKPLALSLYHELITESIWRTSRQKIGYNDPGPYKLMEVIGGHPYIDVRKSFSNFLPQKLNESLKEKLVSFYLKSLNKKPELHDKIEFEIAITCYTEDIDFHLKRLLDNGFSQSECNELKNSLKELTFNIISGNIYPISKAFDNVNLIDDKINSINKNNSISDSTKISLLLKVCKEFGTFPFSILARYGFIAKSSLRGFVKSKILNQEDVNKLLFSIETVASEFVTSMNSVSNGLLSVNKFLEKFGHLRPGTYDLLSPSYQEAPEHYFPKNLELKSSNELDDLRDVKININNHILSKLSDNINWVDNETLLDFIIKAIQGREYAKFQFTKCINSILELIKKIGEKNLIDTDDLVFLTIEDFIYEDLYMKHLEERDFFIEKINFKKKWFKISELTETPNKINSPLDLLIIKKSNDEPNFVTDLKVNGEIIEINGQTKPERINNKIVLIKGADPGFDWIFLHDIKGLITMYGGAASHMTIRCAEFEIPAAIGCGKDMYEKILNHNRIVLDCSKKIIDLY